MSPPESQFLDPSTRVAVAKQYGLLPSQTTHRINILRSTDIKDGDRILEIGCGQGDCTTTLALLFLKSSITAIDPAPLDYGTPETLGQAHDRIKSYDFGGRVTFHQASPVEFLGKIDQSGGAYDVAVLCHCLWYFASRQEVLETLKAARGKVKRLCIAEWGLKSASREADVHVLAALTRACSEAHIPDSDANIRTPLCPSHIKSLTAEAGWKLQSEAFITPNEGLEDARWEVNMLLAEDKDSGENGFLKRVRKEIQEERVHTVIESMLESVKSEVEGIGGKENVRCMEVWIANFSQ